MDDIVNFIFELGVLRRIKHEGWRIAGIEHPESVADHSLRAAQLGYILAKMENFEDPCRVSAMLIFHDIGECRIGDIHKIANRYIQADEAGAVKDQTGPLKETGKEILDLWKELEEKNTRAGIIAKDADLLEQAFTAREYMENGSRPAENWIINVSKCLQTQSAQKLIGILKKTDPHAWWQGLKKI